MIYITYIQICVFKGDNNLFSIIVGSENLQSFILKKRSFKLQNQNFYA